MELKTLLGDELYAQVETKINEHNAGIDDKKNHVRFVDLSEGGYVSKERFGETDRMLKEANKTINSYKEMDIDGIKASAAEWETKYNTDVANLNAKLAEQEKRHAGESFLAKQGFKSSLARQAALSGLMQKEYKDGKFEGADDYIKQLKADDPTAFEPKKEEPASPYSMVRGGHANNRPPVTDSNSAYLQSRYSNNRYFKKK